MAITPTCDLCTKELTEFGAILFSPPDAKSMVKKYHVCKPCYDKIVVEYGLIDSD